MSPSYRAKIILIISLNKTWRWSDSIPPMRYSSEDETECDDMEMHAPRTTSEKLGFNSIYSMDECPDLRMMLAQGAHHSRT
jgi:hypothetical protein